MPESQTSTFKELSQLIRINDICEPFIAEFDNSQSVDSVWDEWMHELGGGDPMEGIALVKDNQKAIGWLGFDMLGPSKTLSECMEPISGDILISSDTPLLEAIKTVCSGGDSIYLVLKGNRFTGFLTDGHFHKLPFRMCLFALLIDLEGMMLEITKSNPSSFLTGLPEGRLNKAKETYRHRGFSLNKANKEYDKKLIDCTSFIDKFKMLKKDPVVIQKCPDIKSNFENKAEKLRNAIAHPEGEESGLLSIKREEFFPFIKWAEKLQNQLDKYLER